MTADPKLDHLLPRDAFALLLETACGEFETLQALLLGNIRLVGSPSGIDPQSAPDHLTNILRAESAVRMALAKTFLFNANRANRVCNKNKSLLRLDRLEREDFLRATKPLINVRDVNEHGFDGDKRSEKNKPSMHEQEGGFLDETSLMVFGPDKIFMGPLNLHDIYTAVARMRSLAGFLALARMQSSNS